jgi:hypothetical protein
VLPGSTHDLTAARELVLPQARPYLTDLPFLAGSGYEGAGAGVQVPVRDTGRDTGARSGHPDPQRTAPLPALPGRMRLRAGVPAVADPAEGDAQPGTIGDITKAVLVLVQFEHTMIS